MGTNSPSETDSPDTDARIDAKPPATTSLNDTTEMVAAALVANATGYNGQSRFFESESGSGDDLDGFVADVTTIAQSQCERCESYADIEMLVCHLPMGHLMFAAHDSLAPYSGLYPMALLVRAVIVEEINGWDETALHDHLRAHPSLCQDLGFESLPNQSTFWRAWNERFSAELRDAIQDCADSIVTAARACDVPLPDRIGSNEPDESEADHPPKHQLVAEKTDEVWQQAKPFVTDAFALDRGQNWQIHENAFWEQHAYMGMREDMYARSGPASFSLDTTRECIPTGSTHRYQIGKLSIAEVREMLRNTTRMLIARARQHGELTGKLWAAIDVTKGFPFTGNIEGHEDDILGYKDGGQYYQWAVLKIVGMERPTGSRCHPARTRAVEGRDRRETPVAGDRDGRHRPRDDGPRVRQRVGEGHLRGARCPLPEPDTHLRH